MHFGLCFSSEFGSFETHLCYSHITSLSWLGLGFNEENQFGQLILAAKFGKGQPLVKKFNLEN